MKRRLIRIIVAAVIFVAALIVPADYFIIKALLFLGSYLVAGYDVVIKAGKSIVRGNVFNENFLMSIATIGAFIIGEYPEAVAVMLFYQIGELFQSYAVEKSRKSITSLMELRPDYANLKKGDTDTKVDPETVNTGDIIIVRPGEKIPLDGIVIKGSSLLDTSALTGESLPRDLSVGDEVLSGCICLNGLLEVEVTSAFEDSTINKILEMVEDATNNKAKTESFITKFARYYTPVVVFVALALAIFPPLLLEGATFTDWVYRALAFLVVSCPCALVIAVPLSFFGGIGGASKAGILIKGGNYVEALANTKVIVFDKTGTLTKGSFAVEEIIPNGIDQNDLLELAAYAESNSTHPISQSIVRAFDKPIDASRISRVEEIAGRGVCAEVDGAKILVGNLAYMKEQGIDCNMVDSPGTVLYVARDKAFIGSLLISDEIKEDAHGLTEKLARGGVVDTVMLTGDSEAVAQAVGTKLGIKRIFAGLLPGQKLEILETIKSEDTSKTVAFVGDGINDAPALARADVGIAMGALGSDAAIEAADVVIMNDEPSKIVTAIAISKKTLAISRENIVFALGVKAVVLVLVAFGLASMWGAVFADVGVTILAVLNAFRALHYKEKS